jgi:glycosyltransferase involved in cell wall biosynthesis
MGAIFKVNIFGQMSTPYISVVITTYNYGSFIEQSIDSVLSQDFPADKLEIVVADDGSTDDTAERVRKYDSRVRYFYKPNGGQASALNLGFAQARGEIVTLLDGDDFFLPGKLARVAEAFQQDAALGMVYHPMLGWNVQTDERKLSQFPLISGSPFEDPKKFFGYAGPGTCMSFRRKFLDRVQPIPEKIRMLADAYPGGLIVFIAPILALPECLSVYRVHGTNSYQVDESRMPVETRMKRIELWQIVIAAMRKWLADNGFTRRQPFVSSFLNSWSLYITKERFLIKPPGRLRFFWSLVLENTVFSPLQTLKLTAFNYLWAPSALLFGYQRERSMYAWRRRAMEAAIGVYRTLVGTRTTSDSSRTPGQ